MVTKTKPRRQQLLVWGPQEETWGEMLRRHVMMQDDLNSLVNWIHEKVDSDAGTRNSFAKLFTYVEPPEGATKPQRMDRRRAYYLLVSLTEPQDPTHPAWGLADTDLPAAFDPDDIIARLATRG